MTFAFACRKENLEVARPLGAFLDFPTSASKLSA
jgi:hypothetical protein